MSLVPNRDVLNPTFLRATGHDTPFRAEADAALASFRALRSDLERQVRRGDLTPKVARQRAADNVEYLRRQLLLKAEGYSPTRATSSTG